MSSVVNFEISREECLLSDNIWRYKIPRDGITISVISDVSGYHILVQATHDYALSEEEKIQFEKSLKLDEFTFKIIGKIVPVYVEYILGTILVSIDAAIKIAELFDIPEEKVEIYAKLSRCAYTSPYIKTLTSADEVRSFLIKIEEF